MRNFKIIIVAMIIFSTSCKKNNFTIQNNDKVHTLKNWITNNPGIIKSETIQFNVDGKLLNQKLNWKDILTFKNKKGTEISVISFFQGENGSQLALSTSSEGNEKIMPSNTALIISQNLNGEMSSKIRIRMFDTTNHRDRKVYDFYYNSKDGKLMYTWLLRPTYNPQRIYLQDNMQVKTLQSSSFQKRSQLCSYYSSKAYTLSCVVSPDGTEPICTYQAYTTIFSFCPSGGSSGSGGEGENQTPQDDYPDGGGGGYDPNYPYTPTTVKIDTVDVSNLTTPCLSLTFAKLTSAQVKGTIARLYNSTYSVNGHNMKLEFRENPNLVYSNGEKQLARSIVIFSQQKWVIELNPTDSSASQEAVGSAIAHELVHSFIMWYKEYRPEGFNFSELETHSLMLNSWINAISGMLIDAFGMNPTDATALSIDGVILGTVIKENGGATIPEAETFIKKHYSITVNQVKTLSAKYYNKQSGTYCY